MTESELKDVKKLMEPYPDGVEKGINPCCGDWYYGISMEKKYGEEKWHRMCDEYKRNGGRR